MKNENLCARCLDYTLGEIQDELFKRRYEKHLASCRSCQTDMAEYQEILESLQTNSVALQAIGFPRSNAAKATVISFPRERVHVAPKLRQRFRIWRQRGTMVSLTFTVAAMMLAVLVHTGHIKHVAVLGDSAFDHVTHVVRVDSSHIKHDFTHI